MCSELNSSLPTKAFNTPKQTPKLTDDFASLPKRKRAAAYRLAARKIAECGIYKGAQCPVGSYGCMGSAVINAARALGFLQSNDVTLNPDGNTGWSLSAATVNDTPEVKAMLGYGTRGPFVQSWNDMPERTTKQVVAALKTLATMAEHGNKTYSEYERQAKEQKAKKLCSEPASGLPFSGLD